MDWDTLSFFDQHQDMLPLYQALEEQIQQEVCGLRIKVQKSQISFYNRHMFGCVSFLRVKKKKEMPPSYIVLTLCLARRVESPRIAVATEPYPGRWTHHIVLSDPGQLDDELMAWVREAAAFSDQK